MALSKRRSCAYRMEPLLFHKEVLALLLGCFPDDQFVIHYESADLCSNVRILGHKLTGDGFVKECLRFDILQETNPDARTTFDTNFWVTIHDFQPCTPQCSDGQIQSLMERMIEFMAGLEDTSPGEYRLKVTRDIPSMYDENQIPGVNMRALYALAHGQTRLNALGFQHNLFDSKYLDFEKYLQLWFTFPNKTAKKQTFDKYRDVLGLPDLPKTGLVFQGIYRRVRFWNDKLNHCPDSVVDMVELTLYCAIIDAHVANVEKHFPSNTVHLLKIQRHRAPEPEVKVDAVVKLPITAAQRLSKPYYTSAFPTRKEEREAIRQDVMSRRRQPTL